MHEIRLNTDDIFRVARGLIFSEKKRLHACSDVFGDELRLTPDSRLGEEPLTLSAEEIAQTAGTVAGFFTLDRTAAPRLERQETIAGWVSLIAGDWDDRQDFITFFTSGSTGTPKPVRRRFSLLAQDAVFLSSLHDRIDRVVTQVPPHHIYGFIYTILIPGLLNVTCSDLRFAPPGRVAAELAPGDLAVGTPFTWKLLAGFAPQLPDGVEGVTSTAPCPAELVTSLLDKGLEKMVEIYGSTECGAMGYRFMPGAPMTLSPLWEKIDGGNFIRRLPDGSPSEPFRFQDELEWLDDTRFRVLKRVDTAVQIAGVNVFPDRVAEVIRACDMVADCAVRLMRPDEGDRLKAFIVLEPGLEPDEGVTEALREQMKRRLSHFEQPRELRFGDALPRNEMGKAADW